MCVIVSVCTVGEGTLFLCMEEMCVRGVCCPRVFFVLLGLPACSCACFIYISMFMCVSVCTFACQLEIEKTKAREKSLELTSSSKNACALEMRGEIKKISTTARRTSRGR